MRYLIAAAALVLALAACGSSGPSTTTAHGSLQVFANPLNGQTVQDSYPDITSGAQVTVTDASGKVVGTGTLEPDATMLRTDEHMFAAAIPNTPAAMYGEWVEAFSFTVRVPAGLSRYGIAVGHRGTIWFTPAQLRKGPALSLGSMSG